MNAHEATIDRVAEDRAARMISRVIPQFLMHRSILARSPHRSEEPARVFSTICRPSVRFTREIQLIELIGRHVG